MTTTPSGSGAAFSSQRIAAHLQLDSCRTLRARVATYADPVSRESRAMARVMTLIWHSGTWLKIFWLRWDRSLIWSIISQSLPAKLAPLHRLTGGSRFDTKNIAHACAYIPVVRSP